MTLASGPPLTDDNCDMHSDIVIGNSTVYDMTKGSIWMFNQEPGSLVL